MGNRLGFSLLQTGQPAHDVDNPKVEIDVHSGRLLTAIRHPKRPLICFELQLPLAGALRNTASAAEGPITALLL